MASVEEVLTIARRELGTREDPAGSNRVKYSAWYGIPAAWCQMFANWVLDQAGLPLPAQSPAAPKGTAYTPTAALHYQRVGAWSSRPSVGALVFYDFAGDGVDRISHVGIVEAVQADGAIVAIEGNTDPAGSRTGGQVMRKIRRTGMVGYGRPPYDEGSLSMADADDILAAIKALQGPRGADLTDILRKIETTYNQVNIKAGETINGLRAFVDQGLIATRQELLAAVRTLPTDTWDDAERAAFLAEVQQLEDALAAVGAPLDNRLDPAELGDALADSLAARLTRTPPVPTP